MHKKQKRIKVARVDIKEKYPFIEKEGLVTPSVPAVFIYIDGNYYLYEGNARSRL